MRERSFWPMKRSIAACSSRGSLVNSCAASVAPVGVDDGGDVVGAQVLVDELVRRLLDQGAAQRGGVVVVEEQHVDAAFERPGVRADVRHDRPRLVDEAIQALDRDHDLREEGHLLQLAVFVDLEILAGEALHEVGALVGDDRVDLDVLDLGPEGHRRNLLGVGRSARAAARPGAPGRAPAVASGPMGPRTRRTRARRRAWLGGGCVAVRIARLMSCARLVGRPATTWAGGQEWRNPPIIRPSPAAILASHVARHRGSASRAPRGWP